MIKKGFCLFCILLAMAPLRAQEYPIPDIQISLSYFGEFFSHAGFRLGVSTPVSQRIKEKSNDRAINKGWVAGAYLTYYKHTYNHQAVLVTASIGRQRIGAKGFITQLNLEAGYMASFLDGEAFEWNGNTFEDASRGSSHAVLGLNGGVGWDFNKKSNVPISFLINPHLYLQAPFNTTVLPRLALEGRLSYHLK